MSNRVWRGNRGNHYREGNFRGWGGRGAWGGRGGRGRGWFGPKQNGQNFTNSGYADGGIYQQQERNRFPDYRSSKRTLTKRLSEPQIGVTEFINDNKGFNGIIKSRYSDFQVSELNMNGEVAKLTSLVAPELPKEKEVDEDEDLLLNKYNLELLPIETWDQINKLAIAQRLCTEKVQVDVTGMTKEQRTMIHDAVKKAFGRGIVGSTVTIEDKKYVCFEKFRKGVRIDRRVKWLWPGEYVYFIVHKENCDTMEAAARIAERLRLNLKPSLLGYAGTKDRRAKTSQWFSLRKVDPKKIEQACRDLNGIHVGNYSFADVNIRLGMLKGNKFRIVLRNVTADDALINEACELLQQRGFINYYGLQRFGTRIDTPTYEIGLKLFQGKLLEAINSILEQREGPLQRTLQVFHGSGPEAAWRAAPRRAPGLCNELRLIKALAANPADLLGAIGKIPRNARLLYIHSYQSLVWNRAASERLRRCGLQPAAGDLVPLANVHIVEEIDVDDDSDNEESETTGQKADNEADNTETTDDKDSDKKKKKGKEKISEEGKEVPVKVLTQEDIDSGQYTIFDVVLPLPGAFVQYPSNMLQFYEDLLTADGLTLDMKNKSKWFSMSGAYRHLVVRPSDMEWRCVRYSDPYADLQLSDYDELCGNTQTGIVEDGKFKALLLTLTLPTSCYATMALRELLKVDTSCDNQALQNNYHQKKDVTSSQDGDSEPVTETSENGESQDGGEKRKMAESEAVDAKKAKQDD